MGYVSMPPSLELSRVDGSVGISVAAHNSLCLNHIYQVRHRSVREVSRHARRGEHLGAWGLTEPNAGSDASGTKTLAVRSDGGWIVNGSKNFITHAIHGDTCVAMAVTDRNKRSKGISAFIFEKGRKGFSPSKKENKLGLRASETASVVFEDCFVPDDNLLGLEGQGFINSMEILDGGRILLPHSPLVLHKGRSNRHLGTWLNDNSLVNRFQSFRQSSLSWRIWRRRSTPPVYHVSSSLDEGPR